MSILYFAPDTMADFLASLSVSHLPNSNGDVGDISEEDATALVAALDEVHRAAQELIAAVDRNISLLRSCNVEAETAAAILRNSNDFAFARARESHLP